jgi:hypothetical protein
VATATLTTQITATNTITSVAVTAMPTITNAGEVLFVSQGLPTVEQYVASVGSSVGDLTIAVVSKVAAATHLVGENVAPAHTLTAVGRTMSPVQTPRMHRL